MKLLTIEDLRMLAGAHRAPCITLTLPVHREPVALAQDEFAYRGLVTQAERALAPDLPTLEREALLAPLRDLVRDPLWQHPLGGLAVFRSSDLAAAYRLPGEVPRAAQVDDHFHVKALLPFLRAATRYLVLTLAQHRVALYQGTLLDLAPVPAPGVPRALIASLSPEWRVRFEGARGEGPLVFEASIPEHEGDKVDVERFFRRVDEALWPHLRESELPMILAGVESCHTLYRHVTRYRHIAAEGVLGSVERDGPAQLLEKVRPIAERLATAREDEALADYRLKNDHLGRATTHLDEAARAAVQGRVHRLFVAEGARIRGHLVPSTGALVLRGGDESEDLIESLAEVVLQRSGEVMALPQARMPGGHAVAAQLRW